MERKFLKGIGIMNIILGIIFIITIVGLIPGIALLTNGIIFNNYSKLSDKELQTKKGYIFTWSCILIVLNTLGAILGFVVHDKLVMNPAKTKIKERAKIIIDKQTKKIDILLKLGVLMVGLAGLIFATTTWRNISTEIKLIFLLMSSVFFFVLYFISRKYIKIKSTQVTYYILGWLFILFAIISAGHFEIFGIDEDSEIFESVLFFTAGIGSYLSYRHFTNKSFFHITFTFLSIAVLDIFSINPLNENIALCIALFISTVVSNILLNKNNKLYKDFNILRLVLSFVAILFVITNDMIGYDKIIASAVIIIGSFIQLVRTYKTSDNIFFLILSDLLILSSFIPVVSLKEPLTYIPFAGAFASIQLIELSIKENKITILINEIITTIVLFILYFITFNNSYDCYYLPLIIAVFILITHIADVFIDKENKAYKVMEPIKVGLLIGGIQFCLSKFIPIINIDEFAFITPLLLLIIGLIKNNKIYFALVYLLLLFLEIINNVSFTTLMVSIIISITLYLYLHFKKEKNNIQIISYLIMLLITYANLNTIGVVYDKTILSLLICVILFITYSLLTDNKWLKRVSYLLIVLPYFNLRDVLVVNHENILFVLDHLISLYYSIVIATFISNEKDKNRFILITVGLNLLLMIISTNIFSGVLAGILSLCCIYFGFFKEKYNSLYKMGIILGLLNIIVKFKTLWFEIPFWCYLLIGGLIIIAFATYKQIKMKRND